jgi:hypothetical protein
MRSFQLARVPTLLAFALTAAFVAPRVGRAQELSVGARVRVSAPELNIEKRTGTITRLTADSLSVDFGGRPPRLTTAIDRVARLEVPVGKDRGAGFMYGAGLGTMVGAVVGLGVGAIATWRCESRPDGSSADGGIPCSVAFLFTLPIGAAVGLVAGGIIGAASPPDRWEEVYLRRRGSELGMSGVVRPMRFGLSVSF